MDSNFFGEDSLLEYYKLSNTISGMTFRLGDSVETIVA